MDATASCNWCLPSPRFSVTSAGAQLQRFWADLHSLSRLQTLSSDMWRFAAGIVPKHWCGAFSVYGTPCSKGTSWITERQANSPGNSFAFSRIPVWWLRMPTTKYLWTYCIAVISNPKYAVFPHPARFGPQLLYYGYVAIPAFRLASMNLNSISFSISHSWIEKVHYRLWCLGSKARNESLGVFVTERHA